MILNQWYAILESNEINKGKITTMTRMGEKMAAWRNAKGDLDVMEDKCPYRGLLSVWAR
jgi:Phenylpropionate dioxygenase and related ring-hydroxylating dioxygenases, large terminal subunit